MKHVFYIISFFITTNLISQDYLLNFIEDDTENNNVVFATFKGTKIINLQSIEMTAKDELEFIISHRFGKINSGIKDVFGLDYGKIRMSFSYGISDNFNLGIARSSYDKVIDASAKFNFFKQGKRHLPISIGSYSALFFDPAISVNNFNHRFSYVHQFLFARKFNQNFSMQVVPTLVHYNLVSSSLDNDLYSIGLGGRCKINPSVSINLEWIPIVSSDNYIESFSVGCDIETGGHVFQMMLSNSTAMYETGFISANNSLWKDGGIHFGFNISRIFDL